jgi:hypothetical protein
MLFSSRLYELRHKIWNLLIEEPRLFELYLVDPPIEPGQIGYRASRTAVLNLDRRTPSMAVKRTVLPLLLQICHESREVGLRICQMFWAGNYVNFAIDRVLIAPDLFGAIGWCINSRVGFGLHGLGRFEHVVLFFPYEFSDDESLVLRLGKMSYFLVRSSPELRTITFVFDDNRFLQAAEHLFKAFLSTEWHSETRPRPELLKDVIPLDDKRDIRCKHGNNIYL